MLCSTTIPMYHIHRSQITHILAPFLTAIYIIECENCFAWNNFLHITPWKSIILSHIISVGWQELMNDIGQTLFQQGIRWFSVWSLSTRGHCIVNLWYLCEWGFALIEISASHQHILACIRFRIRTYWEQLQIGHHHLPTHTPHTPTHTHHTHFTAQFN